MNFWYNKTILATCILCLFVMPSTGYGAVGSKLGKGTESGAMIQAGGSPKHNNKVLGGQPRITAPKNVIVILADDLGIGDVSMYGCNTMKTPNLERLASEGMTFNKAYANGSVCSPTRYGLMTGLYPCRGPIKSGAVQATPSAIQEGQPTVASYLKQRGFRTAMIGKWHLGYGKGPWKGYRKTVEMAGVLKPGPVDLGFDVHFGLPVNHNDLYVSYVINDRMPVPEVIAKALHWTKKSTSGNIAEDGNSSRYPTDMTKEAVQFLEKHCGKETSAPLEGPLLSASEAELRIHDEADSRLTSEAIRFIKESGDQRFFLYLALNAIHTHITPAKAFRGRSQYGSVGDYIEEMDHHVGEIMDLLEKLGIAKDTLVIFSSDNGGQLNDYRVNSGLGLILASEEGDVRKKARDAKKTARRLGHKTNGPLRGGKAMIWEGGFRVPLIVRWPAGIKANTSTDQLVCLTDIFSTVAHLVDKNAPDVVARDSVDLSPVLTGQADAPVRNSVLLQSAAGELAYRVGDLKLIAKRPIWQDNVPVFREGFSLFDLSKDPYERNNLAKKYPEKVHILVDALKAEFD